MSSRRTSPHPSSTLNSAKLSAIVDTRSFFLSSETLSREAGDPASFTAACFLPFTHSRRTRMSKGGMQQANNNNLLYSFCCCMDKRNMIEIVLKEVKQKNFHCPPPHIQKKVRSSTSSHPHNHIAGDILRQSMIIFSTILPSRGTKERLLVVVKMTLGSMSLHVFCHRSCTSLLLLLTASTLFVNVINKSVHHGVV